MQILHFCQSKKTFRIGKLSHSLTLSFFWFWAFQGNKQCTCSHDKQSASFYIRQDSIDMLHSLTQGHAHTAIGCNQKLMHSVPRRGLQSNDAQRSIRAQCTQSICTHSEENAHSGQEGGACNEHSRRQHDHQSYEHQKPHDL